MRPQLLVIATVVAWAGVARASGPLGREASPIATSQYSVDYFNGPVLSSARVTGLGGAFGGIAEGIDALPINPAAAAVRVPWSTEWFEYDATAGVSFPGVFSSLDFENVGDRDYRYKGFVYPTFGLNSAFGRTGIGGYLDERIYSIALADPGSGETRAYDATFVSFRFEVARSFWDGQLAFGLGLRLISFALKETAESLLPLGPTAVSTDVGLGLETGMVFAPEGARWRLGATARTPISASTSLEPNAEGDLVGAGGFYLPRSVEVPWEVEVGLAYEFGERPLNPVWINPDEYSRPQRAEIAQARTARAGRLSPEEERQVREDEVRQVAAHEKDLRYRRKIAYREMPRARRLVTASLHVSGPIGDGVGPIALLQQRVVRSGDQVSLTPRLGFEAEPIPGFLQARAGVYYEPGRLTESRGRIHVTAGVDVKLLKWTVFGAYEEGTAWTVGAVVDFAERYTNLSLRVGRWR